ncbi:MAG: hypothetical protein FD126_1726 [Elusimicrobia bacterium]|nr:MAG: hypothetical protein FD126_1726 [Elusimicrobiota bacterium]
MLARKRTGASRCSLLSSGLNVEKTLSWVSRVLALSIDLVKRPAHRNVLPLAVLRPERSTPREASSFRCASGKSSPTTPTRPTGTNCLAESEK